MDEPGELTVEKMFAEQQVEAVQAIHPGALGAIDRKKMIGHSVNEVVHQLLSFRGSNPIGMAITVTLDAFLPGAEPVLVVKGTAPLYPLSDDFFTP